MKTLLPWMAVVAVALNSGCQTPPMFATKADSKSNAPIAGADRTRTGEELGPVGAADEMLATRTRQNREPTSSPAHSSSGAASSAGTVAERLEEGHAALQKGQYAEAKRHYEAVLQLRPRHPDAHHRLAIIADNQKDYRAAENHYLAALQAKPRDPNLLSDLGYSYRLQDRLNESERYLKQAIQIQPQHKHALSNLAVLYGTQGDYDGALEMFLQAGDEADAYANMAKLFPEGRPSAGGADPTESNFADEFDALVAADAAGSGSQEGGLNSPTQQLKDMMEQARRDGIAASNSENADPAWARQAGAQDSGSGRQNMTAVAQTPVPGANEAMSERSPSRADPRAWPPHNGGNRSAPTNVPDSGLNEALAEIEQGRRHGGNPAKSSGSNSAPFAFAQNGRGPKITPRFHENNNETLDTDQLPSITPAVQPAHLVQSDPLDSMETWPPTAAESGSRSNVDLASGTIEPWPHAGNDTRGTGSQGRDPRSSQSGSSSAAWPEGPIGAGTNSLNESRIQPADYSIAGSSQERPKSGPQSDAVRKAALLGMSAGPGQMFPQTGADLSSAPSLPPGAGSRINGSQYDAPPRYDQSRSQPEIRSDQAAYDFQTTGQSNFGRSQFGPDTDAVRPAAAMNEGRATDAEDRYTTFSPDGSTTVSHHETRTSQAPRGREPLSDYAGQVQRHEDEFGSVSRRLHAERQLTSPTPPAWPYQPQNAADNEHLRTSDRPQQRPQIPRSNMPSGTNPYGQQAPANPPQSFESTESFHQSPSGSGRPSAEFEQRYRRAEIGVPR